MGIQVSDEACDKKKLSRMDDINGILDKIQKQLEDLASDMNGLENNLLGPVAVDDTCAPCAEFGNGRIGNILTALHKQSVIIQDIHTILRKIDNDC